MPEMIQNQGGEPVDMSQPVQSDGRTKSPGYRVFCAVLAMVSLVLTGILLWRLLLSAGAESKRAQSTVTDVNIMDKFDMVMTNEISNALDGVLSIKKVYWLSDSDLVAPKPNHDHYGQASSPEELQWLLEESRDLLEGQELLFGMDTPVWKGDKIYYYYDETLLVITWKQIIDGCVHTISEIKAAHPSQFRRFLAGGEFGSDKQYVTTEMASSVNAVVATSGDFYKFRRYGVVVYDGKVQRFEGKQLDTCFIDKDGNLLFAYRGDLKSQEQAQQFVDENNIRFSLAFGPVLVENGKARTIERYPVGEVDEKYSRAALCQMDALHYLFVNLTGEPRRGFDSRDTVNAFARNLEAMGVQKAYALDGGQTTVICMDGNLISYPDFGTQRRISDIIYFATALPNGG